MGLSKASPEKVCHRGIIFTSQTETFTDEILARSSSPCELYCSLCIKKSWQQVSARVIHDSIQVINPQI